MHGAGAYYPLGCVLWQPWGAGICNCVWIPKQCAQAVYCLAVMMLSVMSSVISCQAYLLQTCSQLALTVVKWFGINQLAVKGAVVLSALKGVVLQGCRELLHS